jgi:hypothetical protein
LTEHSKVIKSLQTNQQFLLGLVQDLLQGSEVSTAAVKKPHPRREELLRSLRVIIPHPSGSTISASDAESLETSHGSSTLSMSTADMNANGIPSVVHPYNALRLRTTSATGSSCSTDVGDGNAAVHQGIPTDPSAISPTPIRGDTIPSRRLALPELQPVHDTPSRASTGGSMSNSAPATPHFPAALHPSGAMCAYYASAVDRIVDVVRPSNAHMMYRHSVVTMLRKQVRLSLNCNVFATGLHDILCSLPDDPIAVTAIVCKPLLATWHAALTDRLNLVNDRLATSGNIDLVYPEEDEMLAHLPDDYRHPLRHEVSGVSHTKLSVSFCVHLQVDNSVEVEILANNRHELCLLAFLEEVSALVGKDDLFKRSLLLIRAWWFYETAAYVGTPIKHYLKDSNLCIMVCAIFNQYHARIDCPLQALCLFLAEYSAYDGTTQAITLQGIVPFKSPTSSQPILLDAQSTHLITCEVIEKHWNLFNLSASAADHNEYSNANFLRSSSSDDVHHDDQASAAIVLGGSANASNPNLLAAFTSEALQPIGGEVTLRSAPGGIEKVAMKNLSAHNLHYFERQVFNIVHPFNHTNMVAEKLSARRQMRLHKAFQIGANDITVYLRQSIDNADNAGDLLHFFPNLLARFGDNNANNTTGYSPGKPLTENGDRSVFAWICFPALITRSSHCAVCSWFQQRDDRGGPQVLFDGRRPERAHHVLQPHARVGSVRARTADAVHRNPRRKGTPASRGNWEVAGGDHLDRQPVAETEREVRRPEEVSGALPECVRDFQRPPVQP